MMVRQLQVTLIVALFIMTSLSLVGDELNGIAEIPAEECLLFALLIGDREYWCSYSLEAVR